MIKGFGMKLNTAGTNVRWYQRNIGLFDKGSKWYLKSLFLIIPY